MNTVQGIHILMTSWREHTGTIRWVVMLDRLHYTREDPATKSSDKVLFVRWRRTETTGMQHIDCDFVIVVDGKIILYWYLRFPQSNRINKVGVLFFLKFVCSACSTGPCRNRQGTQISQLWQTVLTNSKWTNPWLNTVPAPYLLEYSACTFYKSLSGQPTF